MHFFFGGWCNSLQSCAVSRQQNLLSEKVPILRERMMEEGMIYCMRTVGNERFQNGFSILSVFSFTKKPEGYELLRLNTFYVGIFVRYAASGKPGWCISIKVWAFIYSASQSGKWISNDFMLSKRMIWRLLRTALTASNTVSDVFWSIRTLKYLPCGTLEMNQNVRFQFLRILKHPLSGNARKVICAPSVQNDLNSYFTEKAPEDSGAFFVGICSVSQSCICMQSFSHVANA